MRRNPIWLCGMLLACQGFVVAGELPDGAFARLGGSAFRHPERPSALAFRPDGKHLASGGADGCVRIWDAATGAELTVLKVKDGHANALAYSGDGKRFVAHFSDEKVRLYDAADYKLVRTVAVKNLDSLSVTDDAKYLAANTTTGQTFVVETETGLDRMEIPDGKAIALSPDGSAVAAPDAAGAVTVVEVPGGKPLAKFEPAKEEKVAGIVWSADSRRIAVASEGATRRVRVYDVAKKEPFLTLDGETPLAFCGANRLALRQAGRLGAYDLGTSKRLQHFGGNFTVAAVTPDGATAATDNASGFATARIRLWNLKDGTEQISATDSAVGLRGLVPTGAKEAFWVVDQKEISAWMPGKVTTLLSRQEKPIVAFARSDEAFILSDGFKVTKVPMSITDVSPSNELDAFPGGVRHLAVAADGSLVAAVTAGEKPRLLIGADGTPRLKAVIPLPSPALGLALHPHKKSVAVIGRDGLLRLWNPEGGDKAPELWKARVPRSLKADVAYSPDGALVAVTSVVRVSLFDAATGDSVANFERAWEDGPYTRVAFSPDSRLLIAGTQGTLGSVVVWEIATRGLVKRFTGGRGTLAHLAVTPDGRTLATIAADDNALLWDLTGRRGQPAPTEKQVKAAWTLLGADAETAWPAVETLRAAGDNALPVMQAGIREAIEAAPKRKLPEGESLRLLRAVAVVDQLKGDGAKEGLAAIRASGGPAGAAAEKALKARK